MAKSTAVVCLLLVIISVANASKTFKVDNQGGYVIKLTSQWFNTATGKIEKWQSGGVPLGKSVSKTVPDTALGIDFWTNIDMVGFPEIFSKHYSEADDMDGVCTAFKVWATIFDPKWASTC